jgi:hypothetical protein
VLATLLPPYANAALIELTATGTIVGGQSYYWNGTQNVAVADGTPLSVTFLLDSATFGPAVVGYNGETLFGAPGGFASCPGVQLPQDPLFPGGITSVVDLQGVTLDNQTAGNVRDCDSVLMWQGPELHVLTVLQDAYNTTRTYYTDGDLATVSPTPTSYYVDETRINLVSINGTLSNSPFSEDEMLDELAQGMTISPYGMTLSAQMFQSFYVCSSSGCGNDASGGAFQRYELAATVTGLSGTIVPVPASLGLLLTGLAAVGLRARQRQPANAR